MSQFEKASSLHEKAAHRLRAAIISGQLPLGQPLSENSLATRFGISKTPVREALRELSLGGLVKVMPQKGSFVFTMSRQDVLNMCYAREALEVAALKLSQKQDPDMLARELSRIVERMKAARTKDERKTYLELDAEFHDLFFALCGNPFLQQAYNPIADRIAALRTRLCAHGPATECLVEHDAIAALGRQGAHEEMVARLSAHIGRVAGSYAEQIDTTVSDETAAIQPQRRSRRTARS